MQIGNSPKPSDVRINTARRRKRDSLRVTQFHSNPFLPNQKRIHRLHRNHVKRILLVFHLHNYQKLNRFSAISCKDRFEYKIIRCTDRAWINKSKVRIHDLACNLFNTLKNGDIIAFDPMLSNGSRRQCRFDIGQVVRISYPYDIEISM